MREDGYFFCGLHAQPIQSQLFQLLSNPRLAWPNWGEWRGDCSTSFCWRQLLLLGASARPPCVGVIGSDVRHSSQTFPLAYGGSASALHVYILCITDYYTSLSLLICVVCAAKSKCVVVSKGNPIIHPTQLNYLISGINIQRERKKDNDLFVELAGTGIVWHI